MSPQIHYVYDWYDGYMNITVLVVGVLPVVEEGIGIAVDNSGMDCVTSKRERHWCDFVITLNTLSYIQCTCYM